MNKTSRIIGVIVVLIVVIIFGIIVSKKNINFGPSSQTATTTSRGADIRVRNPIANALIQSPVTLEGRAQIDWFEDGKFAIALQDGNGTEIAQGIAQAQGSGEGDEYVSFVGTLMFSKPATATGFMVLKKPNSSGLPENNKTIRYPVRF